MTAAALSMFEYAWAKEKKRRWNRITIHTSLNGLRQKRKMRRKYFHTFSFSSFFPLSVPKLAWNLIHPPLILHRLQHATPLSRISQHRRRLEKFISCDEWRRLCSNKSSLSHGKLKINFPFQSRSILFFFHHPFSLTWTCVHMSNSLDGVLRRTNNVVAPCTLEENWFSN